MTTKIITFMTTIIIVDIDISAHHAEGGPGAEHSHLLITAGGWSAGQDWRHPGRDKHTKSNLPQVSSVLVDTGAGEL